MNPNRQQISIAIPAASCVAVIAFAVSLAVGATVDNPMGAVLARSLVVMIVAWPIGFALGVVLEHLFREQVSAEIADPAQNDVSAGESGDDVEIIDEPDAGSNGSGVAEASATAAA